MNLHVVVTYKPMRLVTFTVIAMAAAAAASSTDVNVWGRSSVVSFHALSSRLFAL